MFQTFEDKSSPGDGAGRVAALRAEMRRQRLDGFIVPHADEHQSEYLPPSAERLAWLTGFTGSAGMAIVLAREAAVFVDGRYTLQVATQVDTAVFTPVALAETPPSKWLGAHAGKGERIGYDSWLLTAAQVKTFSEACQAAGAELVAADPSPLDGVWSDRPPAPVGQVVLHPLELAGESAAEKLKRIQAALADKKADLALITQADSVAWTFNIRGSDIPHNPVPLAFALLSRDRRPDVFIDGRKLSNSVRSALAELAEIRPLVEIETALVEAAKAGASVLLDPKTTPAKLDAALRRGEAKLVEGADPTVALKACKNAAEIEGARRAHLRDGIALTRFLAWLDREAPGGRLDEISAVERLEEFRREVADADGVPLADISFDTISGAGPNGAIVHYRVTRNTKRRLEMGTLYLVDSGGQYRDGTTDVTRTVALGTPTPDMRDRFTRVLKGHIALASARFPAGTVGAQLDAFARQALWNAGLDFDHGTGHGVGSFLSVHEEAARISKNGHVPLAPGMILSNEPGYYRTGAYGIRIENLVLVKPPEAIAGGERPMLGFETLTLAPIDRRLIDPKLLSPGELAWLNEYHHRVRSMLAPRLSGDDLDWLMEATEPIG
ncbi:MAG: aminopeptidase P family protein [Bauldia sp.]